MALAWRGSDGLFRVAPITTDGKALGTVAFARKEFIPGDLIQRQGRSLRIVRFVDAERHDDLPLLVVEPSD